MLDNGTSLIVDTSNAVGGWIFATVFWVFVFVLLIAFLKVTTRKY